MFFAFYLFFVDIYRRQVFLLVKCPTSCELLHSQLTVIRVKFVTLPIFYSHWTPMGWCPFIWMKLHVGLV